MNKSNFKFKCTYLYGYGDADDTSHIFTLEEMKDHNLDAYMGDDWSRDFEMLQVGEELLVGGPCGSEEVKYERIS
jgi:hypothetical protein